MNTDSQWGKQEACFACATQVWLAVKHNTSVTSGNEFDVWSVLHGQVSLAVVNQIYVIHEAMNDCKKKKSKDSLKNCFENVHIVTYLRWSLVIQVYSQTLQYKQMKTF